MGSSKPELVWIHAASVGAACQIIIVLEFGVETTPTSSVSDSTSVHSVKCMTGQMRDSMAMELVTKLIGHRFEMLYLICECSVFILKGLIMILGAMEHPYVSW